MRLRALGPAAALVLAAAALSGCSTVEGILNGATLQVFEAGQCLDTDGVVSAEEASEVGEIPVVDCTEAHDAEVYYVTDTTATEFDQDALYAEVDQLCYDEFADYVGTDYETSSIYYATLYPTQDSWDIDDRQLVCLLTVDEDVAQSFAGSGL